MAALLLVAIWLIVYPPLPHLPTSDLFTHLSVARHLLQGDGFVSDVTYPLSFAFDFARQLPQPLIHRGPGFALLLTIPVAQNLDDPTAAVQQVRWLQLGCLALIVWIGTSSFLNRRKYLAVGSWLVFLLMSPLLVFSVSWAFSELQAGLILLLLWLRHRDVPSQGPGPVDGFLAGMLILLRWDLLWLPLLWWVWGRLELRTVARRKTSSAEVPVLPPVTNRRLLLALAVVLLINLPWLVRSTRLTGNPFFTLQANAELVKDTRSWPQYSVYRQLDPQPLAKVLSEDPIPVLRKFVRGLKFYFRDLGRLFPWAGLVVMALGLMVYLRGGIDSRPCPLRPNAQHPMTIIPDESPLGPLVTAGLSLIILIFQYSFFDHSLRHLLVLYPLLTWEWAGLLADLWDKIPPRAKPRLGLSYPTVLILTYLLIRTTLQPLPGWEFAAEQARAQIGDLAGKTQSLLQDPAPVPFVDSSAAPWYANRPAVWDPGDEKVRIRIRKYLSSTNP